MKNWMVLLALVAACSDDADKSSSLNNTANNSVNNTSQNASVNTDAQNNNVASDAGVDAMPDAMEPAPECDAVPTDLGFAIDPDGEPGQFYSSTSFDGRSVWVVHNRPQSATNRNEGIFVTRIACDGSTLMPPTAIHVPDLDARNYSPVIASSEALTAVVWIQHPNSGNEKQVMLKTFSDDGNVPAEAVDITPAIGEMPLSETVWQPDVALFADEVVVVAESLGADAQVVVHRVTRGGMPTATFLAHDEKGVNQSAPAVGMDDAGNTWVVWMRSRDADPANNIEAEAPTPVYASYAPEQTVPREGEPVAFPQGDSPFELAQIVPWGPSSSMLLAYHAVSDGRSQIVLRALGNDLNHAGSVGSANHVNFRPTLASSDSGAAVAWYRYTTSPQRASVVVQALKETPMGVTAGPESVVLATYDAIQPYGPGLTHVKGDTYFVTYTQGSSAPEARVFGRFVTVTQP